MSRFGIEINVVTGEVTQVELPDLIEETQTPTLEEPTE